MQNSTTAVWTARVLAWVVLALCDPAERIWATTYYVNAEESIQSKIDDPIVEDGDEIIVAPGRYTENLNYKGKNITLRSTNPKDPNIVATTIIDGGLANSVVTFNNGEDANAVLSGFTITQGWPPFEGGGGIYCEESSPTISHNIITENYAFKGGGLICYEADPLIIYNIISQNASDTDGGGISCYNSKAQILYNIIKGNLGVGEGGGIYSNSISSLTIRGNLIIDNSAEADGGGIHYIGGGLVKGNTIAFNSVIVHQGGGILGSEYTQLLNNTLWRNEPNDTEGIPAGSIWYNTLTDPNQAGFQGNISSDPLFADPNNGDYHLKSQAGRWDPNLGSWTIDDVTSPCIGAGNPGSEPDDPTNVRIETGAYGGTKEESKAPYLWVLLGDLTNDGTVDFKDYAAQQAWQIPETGEQPWDLNRDGLSDLRDLELFTLDWLRQRNLDAGL